MFVIPVLELLNQILIRSDRDQPIAVCVLVATHGSTPQKAGAMMVVLGDGKTLGTIGGGCVEAEVRTRAFKSLGLPGVNLFRFDLNHDHGWDDGLVCGGSMEVAVISIVSKSDAVQFRTARDLLSAGQPATLPISAVDEQGKSHDFFCPMAPAPRLIIAGAGHVGAALSVIAHQMEFDITVIDDRPEFASEARFPMATRQIGAVETELARQRFDQQSYVVIVTRGHKRDALALAAVVKSDCRYIGLIGSKRKIVTIFKELHDQGVSRELLKRVHAPVGFDIGAVSPAEIAVSIAAELVAVRRMQESLSVSPMRLKENLIDRL